MRTDHKLTVLSKNELDRLLSQNVSAGDAYNYISEGLRIRSFRETLSQYYSGDLKSGLTDGLKLIEKNLSGDSVARKVRDWLSGKYVPDERADLIKICFALGLCEIQANGFLSMTADGGFHLRNPEELAYSYCLRVGKRYAEAASLIAGLKPLDSAAGKSFSMTKTVADAFQNVRDDKAFHRFYEEQYDNLGKFHNTAYSRFLFFLDMLIDPSTTIHTEPEQKYSVDEVVEIYLRMNLPLDKQTAKMTLLQKTIRKYWPNATNIIKMRSRAEDVTRRALMLLYLVTEGAIPDDGGYNEELTERELFDEHYWRLNSMLHDCGMSRLDPRGVFDWLVLYCLKTDGNVAMSERMQNILGIVFGTETS